MNPRCDSCHRPLGEHRLHAIEVLHLPEPWRCPACQQHYDTYGEVPETALAIGGEIEPYARHFAERQGVPR